MRIAYLILCHKNPEQVLTLIRQLDAENVDFYVHIDRKAKNFMLPGQKNLFVLPFEKRIDVRWATNSMVYATLNLVHAALNTKTPYDYICLLSGQDFPIKSNREIHNFLQTNNGLNFIQTLSKEDGYYRRLCKRNELYYPSWMFSRSSICKIFKRLYIYLTGGFGRTFSLCQRKVPNAISFAFGSQWWCLTRDCLRWIVAYLDHHPEVLHFFDHALTPDECIFQTVFELSPFSKSVMDKLTYLEWDSNGNSPRILTEADYNVLINSKSLWARKFDAAVDKHTCVKKLN